jgi:hypothetical protein
VATTKPQPGGRYLYAFALPFCVFGAVLLGFAIYQARARNTGLAAFSALSGFIFAGVGIGLILTLRHGAHSLAAADRLREEHPGAPWLWRNDWAAGHIFSEGGGNALAAWLFATFWNAISWPIFYFIYFNPSQPTGVMGGLAILFAILPLTGIVLIGWAVRTTLRWLVARGSFFEMVSIPGQIGGTLTGTVRLMPPSRANREFKVALSCVNRIVNRSGNRPVSSESTIWSEEQTVRGNSFGGIPVEFFIPSECRPTDTDESDNAIIWRLAVTAPFSTRSFEALFEVPVFSVAHAPSQRSFDEPFREDKAGPAQTHVPPPNFPVRVRTVPTGATEFYFPPCRAPAAAIGASLFAAGWSAMFLMIIHIDAPIVFQAVWAGFEAFMIFWVASLWLGDTRVIVDRSSISILRGIPGLALSRRIIPASEVHAVAVVTGSRAGAITYYRLRLTYRDGRKLSFGDGIRQQHDAEWLAREIGQPLGVAN